MTFFDFMSEGDTSLNRTNIKHDVYGEPRVTEIDDEIPELYESDSDSDDDDDDYEEEEEMKEDVDEEVARILKRREAIKESEQKAAAKAALKSSKITNINKSQVKRKQSETLQKYSINITVYKIAPTQKVIGHVFINISQHRSPSSTLPKIIYGQTTTLKYWMRD